jgi:hypothetical protein
MDSRSRAQRSYRVGSKRLPQKGFEVIALILAGTIMAGVFIRWAVVEDRQP